MKYKLTKTTKVVNGRTLYQIQAIKDFGCIRAGDLGGWVEKESNLSQRDSCWIYETAQVSENAEIFGNARISGTAQVYGAARVFQNAEIFGNSRVFENAEVSGNSRVSGFADIFGYAEIFENAEIFGYAQIFEYAEIFGDSSVFEHAEVSGSSRIFEYTEVYGNARINEKSTIQNTEGDHNMKSINDLMENKQPGELLVIWHGTNRTFQPFFKDSSGFWVGLNERNNSAHRDPVLPLWELCEESVKTEKRWLWANEHGQISTLLRALPEADYTVRLDFSETLFPAPRS